MRSLLIWLRLLAWLVRFGRHLAFSDLAAERLFQILGHRQAVRAFHPADLNPHLPVLLYENVDLFQIHNCS